ncbi:MAG TPA: DUF1194 domain-containing protein [Alphaproteobacteria bacterium]|jgi:hypothetical protein
MRLSRIASLVAVLAFSGPVWAFPAAAADTPVDLELVLTADVSRSIDAAEFQLQRQGYAQAFRDKRVIDAIRGGSFQRIAVTFVEWTGIDMQKVIIDWTLVDGPTSAEAFAEQLIEIPRTFYFGGGTAVGEALFHATTLFAGNGFESERHVVDISGDGRVNRGRPASQGRDYAVSQGIVINGLPILGTEPGLDVYYERQVVGGPGGFSVPAEGFEDFADAVLHKLIREIAAARPVTDTALAARPD